MSSDRSQQNNGRMSRVIKSGSAADLRPAFPAIHYESFTPVAAPVLAAHEAPRPVVLTERSVLAAAERTPDRQAEATDGEARARAMERRAAAFLDEARETAGHKLAAAEAEARETLNRALDEAEQIRAAAREAGARDGFDQGYREGRTAAEAEAAASLAAAAREAESMLAEVRSMAEAIRQSSVEQRHRLLEHAQMELLDLSFAMARQVLRAEIALRPEAMVPMLEAALGKLKGEEEPQIRVSPLVLALLEEHRGRLVAAVPGARRVVLEADPGLVEGDFVAQGTQGFVDGRLERQMQVLESDVRAEER